MLVRLLEELKDEFDDGEAILCNNNMMHVQT